MELFVHTAGKEDPDVVVVEETLVVRELLAEDAAGRIWVEEIDEEVDLDISLAAAGIGHHHHVHRGHCPRVEVIVRFNGETFTDTFGPGATIKKVEKWAFGGKAADLAADQAAKHVLALPGADHFLAANVHVGSLVTTGSCQVTLDLLPRDRFEG
ncbi:MAG: hypothetical protein JWR37_5699 [Mycobacterium sp.]|nr:hypothetical protein [Mycobacterium sp.]